MKMPGINYGSINLEGSMGRHDENRTARMTEQKVQESRTIRDIQVNKAAEIEAIFKQHAQAKGSYEVGESKQRQSARDFAARGKASHDRYKLQKQAIAFETGMKFIQAGVSAMAKNKSAKTSSEVSSADKGYDIDVAQDNANFSSQGSPWGAEKTSTSTSTGTSTGPSNYVEQSSGTPEYSSTPNYVENNATPYGQDGPAFTYDSTTGQMDHSAQVGTDYGDMINKEINAAVDRVPVEMSRYSSKQQQQISQNRAIQSRPEIALQNKKSYIKKWSQTIKEDPKVREQWVATKTHQALIEYYGDVEARNQSRTKMYNEEQNMAVDYYTETGNYKEAHKSIESMNISTYEKLKRHNEIDQIREKNDVNQVLVNGSVEDKKVMMAQLMDENYGSISDRDYASLSPEEREKVNRAQMGRLDGAERLVFINKLRTSIDNEEREKELKTQAHRKQTKKHINKAVDREFSTEPSNPQTLANMLKLTEQEGMEEEHDELMFIVRNQPVIDEFKKSPSIKRDKMLDNLAKNDDYDSMVLHDRLITLNTEIYKAIKDDPYRYAKNNLDWNTSSFDIHNPESVHIRQNNKIALEQQLQMDIPLLSPDEKVRDARHISMKKGNEKIAYIKSIETTYGEEFANDYLDAVGEEDISLRGLSLVDGKTGSQSLLGSAIRKDNPTIVPNNREFKEMFDDHAGNAFKNSPQLSNMYYDLVRDLYAYTAHERGITTGEFQEDIMDDVLKKVPLVSMKTGRNWNIFDGIDEEKHTYVPPKDGWTSADFKQAIKRLPYEVFEDVPNTIRGEQTLSEKHNHIVRSILFDGNIVLQQEGRNRFSLKNESDNSYITTTDGRKKYISF